uniref:Lipocln_cytosolic_FA-bd_dom domain-containing protein n=1 Tax=Strongyloides venezuelensis TaxID=75913 RepID=A0A0K0EX45_STRVS
MVKFCLVSSFIAVSSMFTTINGQLDAFALPSASRYAAKPTVPPELKGFFELDGHAKELIDTLMGPRPGGYFPEKTFEISSPRQSGIGGSAPRISSVERALENFFKGSPGEPTDIQLPPGFGQGFSLNNNGIPTSFSNNKKPETVTIDEEIEGSGTEPKSSIKGIPKVFPKLPKAPISSPPAESKTIVMDKLPQIPRFASSRPEIPDGGLSPTSEIRRAPVNQEQLSSTVVKNSEYGKAGEGLSEEPKSSGGLIGTVLSLFGLNKEGKPADSDTVNKALTNLIGGNDSPLPAKDMISSVLYKALTNGSVQKNSTTESSETEEKKKTTISGDVTKNTSMPINLSSSQQAAINENLEMIQNLIIQPASPLCNPKPVPVDDFNIDAFMGQWYQVVHSPPLSSGPCSMLAYKKLADVNNGSVGSIFEIFEYTTDGSPYAKPKISSGYAIIKATGELIFRTSSNSDDVNIHVIHNGPINSNGEYEYSVLSANCNYPIYVFARDPVVYKQKYESIVNRILEKKGMINGFSKLFNIVASVDSNMCTFPPSLFNLRG